MQGLSGPSVESVFDGFEVCCGEAGEVGAFREILSRQAVGVLVGTTFPRPPGVGEEHAVAEQVRDVGVAGHFRTLVPGQVEASLVGDLGLEELGERSQQCFGAVTIGKMDELDDSAVAINQGADRRRVVATSDEVAFPVADPEAFLHDDGSLID